MKQLHKKQLYSVNFNINTGKDKFEKKKTGQGGGGSLQPPQPHPWIRERGAARTK